MAAGSFEGHYVWRPSADDHQLSRACTDVRAGRYRSAHEALRDTREDYDLRAHRSLVLASHAADTDLAERWLDEEPGPEAALMWARVAMLRALRMAEAGDGRQGALLRIAEAACDRAAAALPEDPTPWACRLALARVLRPRDPAPRGLLTAPPGPWRLFEQATGLDPHHREIHHRFLACFFPRYGGTAGAKWDVASYLGHRVPASSALRLLPLVALVEDHDPSDLLAGRAWEEPQWQATAMGAYHSWFPHVAGYRFTPVLDLGYLGHALYMGRHEFEAREVLTAMGPYASRLPWSAFGDPAEQLNRARRACGLPVPDSS